MFGIRDVPGNILSSSSIPRGTSDFDDLSVPRTYVEAEVLKAGLPAFKLFLEVGLVSSGGAARRLIEQGGAYINGSRVEAFDQPVTVDDLNDENVIVLRSGKKRFHQVKVKPS
jgi:tyrosyl-tRNA synthetase